jgi:hypothetical protein
LPAHLTQMRTCADLVEEIEALDSDFTDSMRLSRAHAIIKRHQPNPPKSQSAV